METTSEFSSHHLPQFLCLEGDKSGKVRQALVCEGQVKMSFWECMTPHCTLAISVLQTTLELAVVTVTLHGRVTGQAPAVGIG